MNWKIKYENNISLCFFGKDARKKCHTRIMCQTFFCFFKNTDKSILLLLNINTHLKKNF